MITGFFFLPCVLTVFQQKSSSRKKKNLQESFLRCILDLAGSPVKCSSVKFDFVLCRVSVNHNRRDPIISAVYTHCIITF